MPHLQRSSLALTAALMVVWGAAPSHAASEGWTEDFPAAKAEAESAGKDLLLEFTGSDWCPPCQALNKEVFGTSAFLETAPQDFVLVKLDFPNNVPQSETLVNQNEALAEKYNIQAFPTILLADAKGKPYAQTGYRPGGAEGYLQHLEELKAIRETRDAAMAKAKDADGLEKARALDEAMQAVGLELAVAHYPSEVQYIMALDADGEAGLKGKYQSAMSEAQIEADVEEAIQLLKSGDMKAALKRLDKVIDDHEPEGDMLQMITAIKGQVHFQLGETDLAKSLLREAIAVAPDSDIAPQLEAMLGQLP